MERLPCTHLTGRLICLAAIGLFAAAVIAGCTEPAEPLPTAVLLGRVFDSDTGEVIPDGVVVFTHDRIACSGERWKCHWPADAPQHHYDDATILPGFIDLHAHIRSHFVAAYLPAGVTTVRDVSNTIGTIAKARTRSDAPRIIAAGPELDGPGSFLAPISGTAGRPSEASWDTAIPILIAGERDAGEAVQGLAQRGTEWMKLREMLEPQDFEALVAAGREVGLRSTADLGLVVSGGLRGPAVDIVEAADVGLTSLEHFSGLALAYSRRGGDPFSEDLREEILDEIALRLLDAGVHHVPTAAVLHQIREAHPRDAEDLPGWDILGPAFEAHWRRLEEVTRGVQREIAADLRLWQAILDRVVDGGALIGAGSDAPNAPYLVPGVGVHQELAALVGAGLTPGEALKAGTSNAASILGRSDIGSLRAGTYADVIVVRGDPIEDIRASRRILAVWTAGKEVELDAAWEQVRRDLENLDGPIWHPVER